MSRTAWLLAWLAVLALGTWYASQRVQLSTDLTAFLPTSSDSDAGALLDAARNGAAARIMLMAISGGDVAERAAASRKLASALRGDRRFVRVENGVSADPEALINALLDHRYQLSPAVSAQSFTAPALHDELLQRLDELASATSTFTADWITRDPTNTLQPLLALWQPTSAPALAGGVWATRDGSKALLLAETRASGFDLDAQTRLVQSVEQHFRQAAAPGLQLQMTGAGPFGVLLQDRTRKEATLFSVIASVVVVLVLLLAYRSIWRVLLGGLPLISAMLAGLLVSQWFYGGVYGITLAFGMTLIGVAIDYPMHLFSHLHPGQPVASSLRHVWPTLRLSALTTLIAYLTLTLTDFAGLAQLGAFTAAGLATAWGTTRWLLPRLLSTPRRDVAAGWAGRVTAALGRLPVWRWPAVLLLLAALAILLGVQRPLWNDDLSGLTPVPEPLQRLDAQLRKALGAPDLDYVVAVSGDSAQQVLERSENMLPRLQRLQADKAIDSFDAAAQFLPSVATQRRRQAMLPDNDTLRHNLHQALVGTPYAEAAFAPFLADVAAARTAPPLRLADVRDSLIGLRVAPMLSGQAGSWHAFLPLSGVHDVAAVRAALAGSKAPHARLVNLKEASQRMVAHFRDDALLRMAVAVLAAFVIMFWGLPWRRLLPTLLPVAASVLGVAAGYHLFGVRLNLFHIVSLMLVAGLAADYALFVGADDGDTAARARSLHGLVLCLASTLGVFGILGLSEIPVLQAIGRTAAMGVLLGFVLAVLGARPVATRVAGE